MAEEQEVDEVSDEEARGGRLRLVSAAVAASVLLIGAAAGCSDDDDADADDDTEEAADDGDEDGHDHDDEDHDHGEGDEHEGHEMGDTDAVLADFPDAEENGLLELLEDHHWHGEDDIDDLTEEEQELLDYQLEVLDELAEEYPTREEADEVFRRVGPYIPGLGLHASPRDRGDDFDGNIIIPEEVGNPDEGMEVRPLLIFENLEADAELAGFMLVYLGDEPEEELGGFVGAEGSWHSHTHLCVAETEDGDTDFPFVADQANVTDEMCEDVGGSMLETDVAMIHVWSIDGWESDLGFYSEVNPALTCEDGSYHREAYDDLDAPYLTTCVDGSAGTGSPDGEDGMDA